MFNHMLMEMNTLPPVGWDMIPQASAATPPSWPVQTKHGLSEIFVINLERRQDRKERMDFCMRLQGIKYTLVPAVDGKALTQDDIDGLGIRQLPGFSDPHKPRTITRGEVGCFLSHYYLWQKMVPGETYLVLEDDVRFGPDFVADLRRTLREAKDIDWDLIYVGRKRGPGADNDVEVMVTESISNVTYSFWTLGYLITGDAAKVLVDEKPLEKLVPVDEYLPIMYGAHKIDSYTKEFKNKNLKAFSANPVLIQPTHYTGQENYFTDTEPSSDDDILQFETDAKDEL